ncbi:type II toxin-antitoxin system RelE/ParE family toxin [Pseudotabrizicola sp. 4114]|uniref:type II toxin-antitoxin system RelE family toxin n=1 Tax=Pseudotabrizicola sp. 4114 TaxID=2817731 RepID=UPI002860AE4B|nr:mRNA interferase RelE/StbE [Pseudorhodobacter sp. 4114]
MTAYRIEYSASAAKALRRMKDARLSAPIKRAIAGLGENPRPPGCLKLVGELDQWRVRVGEWRIVYRIEDGRLVVTVAPRGGVYG